MQAGIKDIRQAVAQAQQAAAGGHPTVLFLDEVHRFNKAQQDAFLPHVEDGTLTSSLKLRRKAVYDRLRDRFEGLYA